MKLREIVRFEVGYQMRRAWFWVYFVALFAITFQITTEAYTGNARAGGYFFNAPFVIFAMTVLASAMGLLASAGLAGDAASRDVQTRMHPLVYTSPVRQGTYLGGRFLAAFVLNALVLLGVQGALLIAAVMPGVPNDLLGPFRPGAYIGSYLVIGLPNAFVATALLFSLSALTRRAIAAYVGAVLLFALTLVVYLILAGKLGRWDVARLLDPLGFTLVSDISRSTTAAQKNVLSIGFAGALLWNRLVWVGVGLAALAFTHLRFRFAQGVSAGRAVPPADRDGLVASSGAAIVVPRAVRSFGVLTRLKQLWVITAQSFREIAWGWAGLLLVALTGLLIATAPQAMTHLGIPLLPTTQQMVEWAGNTGELLWMIVPVLTVFFAGELVWRDRETRLSEIADVAPVPEWVRLTGRFAGLSLVIAAYHGLLMVACMLIQLRMGYHALEPWLYVRVMFGLQVPTHLLFVALAFAVHVIVNQKYVGHLVAIGAFILVSFAPSFGIEHKLLVFGASPEWAYSDLSGFGGSFAPWAWFKVYWAGWALLLLAAAKVSWSEGPEQDIRSRLKLARQRVTRTTLGVVGVALATMVGVGGFVFYNTNVLNAYTTGTDRLQRRAAYERTYGPVRDAVQPRLHGIVLRVEIYPEQRAARMHGTYTLVNTAATPIDTIHFAPEVGVETGPVQFDRPAVTVVDDRVLGHGAYALQSPLAPGDSMRVMFDVSVGSRGFTNDGVDPAVSASASYFDANEWLPDVGYQPEREIASPGDRRLLGLPPRASVPLLEDSAARHNTTGAELVAFDVVVGTAAGQTALGPGALRRAWAEGGRQYFHYATDAPVRNDFAIYSAKYAVVETRWNDVAIQVVHHPAHTLNAERTARSLRATLDYAAKHLGPYPQRDLRLVERPGDGVSLHASPVNMWFAEGFAILNSAADPRDFDFAFAVVAHEGAHQWWGGQVSPAWVQGGALLSESLAWYTALCVVEETHGAAHMRRILDMMRGEYLNPRSRAGLPLLRSYDRFAAYRKGPFAMYALREYVGVERVNAALRQLLAKHGRGTAPLPTSLDLYAELKAVTPDSLQYLLVDLFEKNAYWELATKRATAEPIENGNWRVTLDVTARKVVVDTLGAETEVPTNDLVEIGVFTERASETPLYRRLRRIHGGAQTITVIVPRKPAAAGIDPWNLLIDVKTGDNVANVSK
jgi:ABC-2 type transport system permease protein